YSAFGDRSSAVYHRHLPCRPDWASALGWNAHRSLHSPLFGGKARVEAAVSAATLVFCSATRRTFNLRIAIHRSPFTFPCPCDQQTSARILGIAKDLPEADCDAARAGTRGGHPLRRFHQRAGRSKL